MTRKNASAPSYIFRRGATYVYRRRVPEDVRSNPSFGGKEHFHKSLRTRELTEARQQELRLTAWFDGEVRRARGLGGSSPASPLPTPSAVSVLRRDDLDAIFADWVQSARDLDSRDRIAAQSDNGIAEMVARRDDHAHQVIASFNDPIKGAVARRAYISRELLPLLSPFVESECKRRGVDDPTGRSLIEQTLVEAEIEVLRTRCVRENGSPFAELPNDQVTRGLEASSRRSPEASWTLSTLAEHVIANHPKTPGWHDKVRYVVRLFEAHLGTGTAICDVTYRHVQEFVDLLRRAPAGATHRFPGMALKAAIEANARREKPYPSLSPSTIKNGYLAVLTQLFRFAKVRMRVIPEDPTDGVVIDGANRTNGTRGPFMLEELQRLFRLPVIAGCKSPTRPNVTGEHRLDDHRVWTPLIMLFSGARPSEIAQLAVSDVKLDAPHPYISILTEYDPNDRSDRDFVVTEKTENARRDVPIHPELIRLGFDGYVQAIRSQGHRRLFPHWKLAEDERKLYSQASWIRQLNERLIPSITTRHPKPTLYSLRHTFKTQMVECDIPLQIQNQILGHAKIGMDKNYLAYGIPLPKVARELGRVTYPGLDLDHLVRIEEVLEKKR